MLKKDKKNVDNATEEVRKILKIKSPKDIIITDHTIVRLLERGMKNDKIYQNLQTPAKLRKAIPQPERRRGRHMLVFEYENNQDKVIPVDIKNDKIIAVTVFPTMRGRYT